MKRLCTPLDNFWRQLADRPVLISLVLFMAGFAASALPTMRAGVILPQEYDEFAYLLGADTFLHGRLANPPHPLAPFFETMHVLQSPTYASKYPPGQSLQLVAGMLIGHPIFGVWITVDCSASRRRGCCVGSFPRTGQPSAGSSPRGNGVR